VALSDKKIKGTDIDQRIPKKSYYALKEYLKQISKESIKPR
jgi:hypothetical protein